MSEAKSLSLVILDEDSDAQVQVKQKDRDQFFVSIGEAVSACATFAKIKNYFTGQVRDLLDDLNAWVIKRQDLVKTAHFMFRPDNSILFVVMQKTVAFDDRLSEELTELDIHVATSEAYNLLTFDVLAIPAVSRESANAFHWLHQVQHSASGLTSDPAFVDC